MKQYDVAIVGAGIVGLAHAYAFASRGMSVVVFERDSRPRSASVRNFGLISPNAAPPGPLREMALRSAAVWRKLQKSAGFWSPEYCGIFTVHDESTENLAREYLAIMGPQGWRTRWMDVDELLRVAPVVKREGLRGGLYGPENILVDPAEAIQQIINHLVQVHGVTFHFNTTVLGAEDGYVGSEKVLAKANHIFVCSGDEFRTLFPDDFEKCGFTRYKLQMFRARPTRADWILGSMLYGPLTVIRYGNFNQCPSYREYASNLERQFPDHVRHGVHGVLAQHANGDVVAGDSHEPLDDEDFIVRQKIQGLILEALDMIVDTSELELIESWFGTYPRAQEGLIVRRTPGPNVQSIICTGGTGLTLAFGIAEESAERIIGPLSVGRPEQS